MDMRPVRLYLLTALHDHLMRLGEARHIAKVAYLMIAREIARSDLRCRHKWLLTDVCERLKSQVHGGQSLNHALSYVWVYDDIRGEMYLDNAHRVVKLIERVTNDYYATTGGLTTEVNIQSTILDSLRETANHLDAPILFSTDYDLLRFRIWFTGEMDDVDMHELWCHDVRSMDEWETLLTTYPSDKYLWRQDHEPIIPERLFDEGYDIEAFWKNISILSLDKLYVMAKERLCSEDDDRCELYTAMH